MVRNEKSTKYVAICFFFEDGTFTVCCGANKTTTSQQTAGFLPGEDVARVNVIASDDIPAEVINRT